MKVCILMGSPRRNGNTAALLEPFAEELKKNGAETTVVDLSAKTINPCKACRNCQDVSGAFGCPQKDDMQSVFDLVLESDLFVLATPIYSWYCTPPMKAALDRLVYGMNKFYGGTGLKECLWKGKKCALLTTCGYPVEKGADLFEQGMERYCKHSKLDYIGMMAVRDEGYRTQFMDDEKAGQVRRFAGLVLSYFSQPKS